MTKGILGNAIYNSFDKYSFDKNDENKYSVTWNGMCCDVNFLENVLLVFHFSEYKQPTYYLHNSCNSVNRKVSRTNKKSLGN